MTYHESEEISLLKKLLTKIRFQISFLRGGGVFFIVQIFKYPQYFVIVNLVGGIENAKSKRYKKKKKEEKKYKNPFSCKIDHIALFSQLVTTYNFVVICLR